MLAGDQLELAASGRPGMLNQMLHQRPPDPCASGVVSDDDVLDDPPRLAWRAGDDQRACAAGELVVECRDRELPRVVSQDRFEHLRGACAITERCAELAPSQPLIEYELERLGIEFKNSRPYHPQTLGNVERAHQTLKRYLSKQPPGKTLGALQEQLDSFRRYYNHVRPHRAIGRHTSLQAYSARLKAKPAGASPATYFRVRQDKVDKTGKVSLRYDSRLYKIGIGRAHKGRAIKLLIADQQIRIIDQHGQLIRELTLDPSRNCQPIS